MAVFRAFARGSKPQQKKEERERDTSQAPHYTSTSPISIPDFDQYPADADIEGQ
jgi:hypothetical protein